MAEQLTAADAADTVGTPEVGVPETPGVDLKKIPDLFKARIATSKADKRGLTAIWRSNVERRLGHPNRLYTAGVAIDGTETQSEVNPDWSLTKTKTANLYSQVPEVRGTHEAKQFAPAVGPFMKAVNYELGEKRANVGVAMEEQLNDVVNAAGIAFVHVGFAARFEEVEVPAVDIFQSVAGPIPVQQIPPELMDELIAAKAIPTKMAQRQTDYKFFITRRSPTSGLWPANFIGSNFNDADFTGFSDATSWPEAQAEWKLKDTDKEKVVSSEESTEQDLRTDVSKRLDTEKVHYDEIYYWRYRVDPKEKSFKAIWKLVFVHGIDAPVVHEPWKGQRLDPKTKKYVGACKLPVQVLTLTYVTDNPVPPSDTQAGGPQVNDLRRSRSQMFLNRERSTPIRWYDVNRIDPTVGERIMAGDFQGIIPTNGDGSRSIGEIARASYPSEDMAFDQAAKADLMESWQIGANQQGLTQAGRQTAEETRSAESNFATRMSQERGRVASHFLNIVEVLAGLMALHSDFPSLSPEERQTMQGAWDNQNITHDLAFKILPDSTIVLDSNQRIEKLSRFLNLTAKSGYVNVQPIIAEMAELSGINPADVIVTPQPKEPDDPSISYRFSGKDDIINPIVLAIVLGGGKPPTAELIEQAKQLLLKSAELPTPQVPQGPEVPAGPPGSLPPGPGGPAGADAHPEWTLNNKIMKRSRDAE